MDFDGGTHIAINEHEIIRVMAGEIESLRPRLAAALQQLGWRVVSTSPLKARRGARGAARHMMSANALEYPATLEISLQPQSPRATQVTFEYRVKHGGLGKGDYQSLTREAEALIALAQAQATPTNCPSCAAPLTAKTRFCRQCGAPTTRALPAEIEIMRLTANARAGYQWTAIGAVMLAIGNLLPLLLFLFQLLAPRVFNVLFGLGILFSLFGWWSLLAGMRRTHLTLNPPGQDEDFEPRVAVVPYLEEADSFAALPAADYSSAVSITEHTTALLHETRAAASVTSELQVEGKARTTDSRKDHV